MTRQEARLHLRALDREANAESARHRVAQQALAERRRQLRQQCPHEGAETCRICGATRTGPTQLRTCSAHLADSFEALLHGMGYEVLNSETEAEAVTFTVRAVR